MVQHQKKSGRKPSGGRFRATFDKKKRNLSRPASLTTIAKTENESKKNVIRTQGGSIKYRLKLSRTVNFTNLETGKTTTAEITDVIENPASGEFRRRDIITKGAILETSAGKIRVTNRPGRDGYINGILEQ